ncbi:MAG: Yip1 family protein [Roseiflexaceae bacterium]|nr:YIP1 family protein [Roseiflexus sp.]MDW8213567.1 Yip1 family protein [Roseiflexaceae bacterium]
MSDRLVSIWTSPRATIREIVDDDPRQYVIPLTVILSIAATLASDSFFDELDSFQDCMATIAIGVVVGIIALYAFSALFCFIGNLLGGYATFQEVRTVYAWSSIPNICAYPAVFLLSLIDDQSPLIYCLGSFVVVLSLWSLVIWIVGLSEVSSFSIWQALLATIIGWLTIAVLLGCIVFLLINATTR